MTILGPVALRGIEIGRVDGAIVSTVVPQLGPEYVGMCERYLGGSCLMVGPSVKTGMPIKVDNPRELGADRLVNAVAAYDRVGGACVAVDFGTSTNFDVVSAAGEYLGGVIGPGVEISMEALTERTAKLPRIDLTEPAPRDRQEHPGGDGVRVRPRLRRAGRRDNPPRRATSWADEATVIATGGLASAIVPFCDTIDEVDDLLTLTGLRLIYDRNR